MSTWLAVLILISGGAVFLGSLIYLQAFLRLRQSLRRSVGLQERALIAARLPPKEAQEELAAIVRELRELSPADKRRAWESHGSARAPEAPRTRFSGRG